MGHALRSLFTPSPLKAEAHALYVTAVTQARQPFLYTGYHVPDTLDGRFDAIVLHVFLLLKRLKNEQSAHAQAIAQRLTETFISDMDRSMREMGVSDTGVGKRIKKMASAFLGRLRAYEEAGEDEAHLTAAITRNLYRGKEGAEEYGRRLSQYAQACSKALQSQSWADIAAHGPRFVN